jgi:glutathione S-transferase
MAVSAEVHHGPEQQVMPAERTLVVLSYSPWSERARWSLDHHGLAYRRIDHAPFLGERRLRRLVGNRSARPTVPVLLAEGAVLTDSWDIALYADRAGSAPALVPPAHTAEIRECYELAERAMAQGRTLVVAGLLASERALDETLPFRVPAFVLPLLRPITRYGTRWFGRKYELDLEALAGAREAVGVALNGFRKRLAGRPYLFERFGFADIVLCSLLQGIKPVADRYWPIGPAQREVWTQPELALEFDDLVSYRDRLYAAHRHAQ